MLTSYFIQSGKPKTDTRVGTTNTFTMKKILMAAVVLLTFGLALTISQVSCSKSNAQSTGSTTPTPVGLVLYEGDNDGNPNVVSFFVCNYDGSNAHQIQVTGLPSGYQINEGARLSPDGKTLFFVAANTAQSSGIPGTYLSYLYSIGVDGSNLKQLTAIPANSSYDATVEGAY
jgi:Tol biopolymer transport system component